jgi:hypothetical protein
MRSYWEHVEELIENLGNTLKTHWGFMGTQWDFHVKKNPTPPPPLPKEKELESLG